MPQVTVRSLDKQGTEGNRGSWVDHLQRLGQVIQGTQQQNPVYSPFKGGTPTLGGNQLMAQAEQHGASLALEQERLNRAGAGGGGGASGVPGVELPDMKVIKYSLSNATSQQVVDMWDNYVIGQGLQAGSIPKNTKESEQWINSIMPGITAGVYDQIISSGGTSKDADAIVMGAENLLRTRAGLSPRQPNTSELDMILQGLASGEVPQ